MGGFSNSPFEERDNKFKIFFSKNHIAAWIDIDP